ncbi:MAG TPA: putative glycoside hydrolase [Gaiellaceae bacterium]|nr:putative glycoside hydrolase [Gaiellaceae bacterium]
MLYPSMDPNERFRSRRAQVRRKKRRRRAALFAVLLLGVLALAGGMTLAGKGGSSPKAKPAVTETILLPAAAASTIRPRPLPVEVRGVHVTGPLASLPGKLQEFVAMKRFGLNTIELDIKDEGGEVGFNPTSVPLVARVGAARSYFEPRRVAQLVHGNGLYLVCRVVVFQDPQLARGRPDLAIRRPDGATWTTDSGLAWVNPYDRRVWDYNVSIAQAGARGGCDEIMFDYVRFPSDGDTHAAVYPGKTSMRRGRLIADFVGYAKLRLQPLGVRVSAALFGLSATRDLGLGQVPRWISEHVDNVNAMTYPALYGGGELGIASPVAEPGETVFRALADFRRELKGRRAQLVPWIQDWSYTPAQVRAQIDAARLQGAKGFILWNATGRYTPSALAPPEGA